MLIFKNLSSILIAYCIATFTMLMAQNIPQGLNFQSIIRDNNGKPIANKNVNIRFSILKGSTNGIIIYSEEHRTISNEYGLVNALIGYGFPTQGRFDQIKWDESSTYLKTEIDPNGGINYELSGISPFLSVPYALYAAKTYLEAGPGISINGNRISNTGDPDPNDDLHNGSPISGDLSGILPNPKVIALQGLPIASQVPSMNQALVWNGNQWLAGNVDIDPNNDITTTSIASGDLSGTYPSPVVSKLNGVPISASKPDSGDVLVYQQGEWKHQPFSSAPGSSYWKVSGKELILTDPGNINSVNAMSSYFASQNRFLSYNSTDSSILYPYGLTLNRKLANDFFNAFIRPDLYSIYYKNQYLVGINAFPITNYADIEFFNPDTSTRARWSFLTPFELQFKMDKPDRDAAITGSEWYLARQSKTSPLEYTGLSIQDSILYFFTGIKDKVVLFNQFNYGGTMYTYDKNGNPRIEITALDGDQSQPYLGLISTKTNRYTSELLSSNNAGEMYLNNSNTNRTNVYAGYTNLGPTYPYLGIGDAAGADAAGMYLNNFGQGIVFGDLKNFRMKDPTNSNQEIWYASIEGPEAAAYERGNGKLQNGEVFIAYSDHFKKVVQCKNVTILLTPNYSDTYGLAVVEKNENGFKVRELKNGTGNFSFDWEVKGIRRGFENYQVVRTTGAVSAANATSKNSIKAPDMRFQYKEKNLKSINPTN